VIVGDKEAYLDDAVWNGEAWGPSPRRAVGAASASGAATVGAARTRQGTLWSILDRKLWRTPMGGGSVGVAVALPTVENLLSDVPTPLVPQAVWAVDDDDVWVFARSGAAAAAGSLGALLRAHPMNGVFTILGAEDEVRARLDKIPVAPASAACKVGRADGLPSFFAVLGTLETGHVPAEYGEVRQALADASLLEGPTLVTHVDGKRVFGVAASTLAAGRKIVDLTKAHAPSLEPRLVCHVPTIERVID
jgi:hypothetical protein